MSTSAKAGSAGAAVTEIVSAGAPVDSEKVAAIRAAIQAGRYPVDPAKIAEKMIEFDLPGKA
ncbi:MAG: flagellar biosynthesis anti-sigma factor FlgM [Allosphingosinicella sp.]